MRVFILRSIFDNVVEFEIVNVVGTITYQQEFDLSELSDTFGRRDEISSVVYEPENNHWLQTHFSPNDTYVPFYRNGKCSIVGVKSLDKFYNVAGEINELMGELLEYDYEPDIDVKNIVATTQVDLKISLENLVISLGLEDVEYEPEQFPSLIYDKKQFTFLIFSSGKIVCTGISELERLNTELTSFNQEIEQINKRHMNA